MQETTPEFHYLHLAVATAQKIISDLPDHDIRNDLDELKLKAYILMRHAAIEEYLEKVSLYALRECKKQFDSVGRVAEPLISACSYYEIKFVDYIKSADYKINSRDAFSYIFANAISQHITALDGVNGIKTRDQDCILNPIGIKIHDFDHVLPQILNNFGSSRGSVAHVFRIKVRNPKAALEAQTSTALRLIQDLDNEICRKISIIYN